MIDNRWMIEEVVETPGVAHVVVSTADGLAKIWSEATPRDEVDRLAAACSGLMSLCLQVGRAHGTGSCAVQEVMAKYEGGWLFVRVAGEGSRLAVVVNSNVDPRLVSQQMQTVIKRLGEQTFSTPARNPSAP
ncbi:roadblock/LC7 domain-containing protein [Nonomuraea maheshkhaliensis]|uniref:Roadblock/LC7 domain-containing protein n=1 Tax=Nonomuraea maheshkhaliensis TaxID=419590 RepID=A0ABP4QLK0_9ACTN